jgi:hypothetical protein
MERKILEKEFANASGGPCFFPEPAELTQPIDSQFITIEELSVDISRIADRLNAKIPQLRPRAVSP